MPGSPPWGIVEGMLNLANVRLRTLLTLGAGAIIMSVAAISTFVAWGGLSSDLAHNAVTATSRKTLLVEGILSDFDREYVQVGRVVTTEPAAEVQVTQAEMASLRAASKKKTEELRGLAKTATERRLTGELEGALAEAHILNDRVIALAAVRNVDARDLFTREGERRRQTIRQTARMQTAWHQTRINYVRATAQAGRTTTLSLVLGGGVSVLALSMFVGASRKKDEERG
jgi:hypothetical protein